MMGVGIVSCVGSGRGGQEGRIGCDRLDGLLFVWIFCQFFEDMGGELQQRLNGSCKPGRVFIIDFDWVLIVFEKDRGHC